MKCLFVFSAFVITFFSCSDNKEARRILEQNGYTNIRMTGYKIYCCSGEDDFSSGFVATSPSGSTVTGCVCSNFITKAATIRFE